MGKSSVTIAGPFSIARHVIVCSATRKKTDKTECRNPFISNSHWKGNSHIFRFPKMGVYTPKSSKSLDHVSTRWCPSSLAKLVPITPITMVYGGYYYNIHGVYKPTFTSLGGTILYWNPWWLGDFSHFQTPPPKNPSSQHGNAKRSELGRPMRYRSLHHAVVAGPILGRISSGR